MDFPEKDVSRESDAVLAGNEDKRDEEMGLTGTEIVDVDKNPDDGYAEIRYWFDGDIDLDVEIWFVNDTVEKQPEIAPPIPNLEAELREKRRHQDGESSSSSGKRRKYSAEELGKALMEVDDVHNDDNDNVVVVNHDAAAMPVIAFDLNSSAETEFIIDPTPEHQRSMHDEFEAFIASMRSRVREEDIIHRHEFARRYAQELHLESEFKKASLQEEQQKQEEEEEEEVNQELQDTRSPFHTALKKIKDRNRRSRVRKVFPDQNAALWFPKTHELANFLRPVPSLLDLSLNALAKSVEAIDSVDFVPDVLKDKLSQLVCDNGNMDGRFVELLARGAPTEIRVKNCSRLRPGEFIRIFGACNTKNLTVLQLDLGGEAIDDLAIRGTLARTSRSLPSLVTISLKGAHRLTDFGLRCLFEAAPVLQSVNISECPFITFSGINALAIYFQITLRELYIDNCQNIDAMAILLALKKLKGLEVLSVAGNRTVSDKFVIEMAKSCGLNLKELVLADCWRLTDKAIESLAQSCSRLRSLDLSSLPKLTDVSLEYLANGCRSLSKLKLHRDRFSDVAVAAFLEVSADSLSELSLNGVSEIGINTALALAKLSINLLKLDLSWCRRLTDNLVGHIVDSCSSLTHLKLFGCTQLTEVFINGHSNAKLQIFGLKMTSIMEKLSVVEPHTGPLRYSCPLIFTLTNKE